MSDLARSLRSPLFLACLIVVGVAAVGMRPTIGALNDRFSKLPVELRQSLHDFDFDALPSFVPDPDAQRYEGADPADLGTSEWISMAFRERGTPVTAPRTVLFVTYYSDPADRVPHTPEVCFQQGGAQVSRFGTTTIPATCFGSDTPQIDVRRMQADLPAVREQLMYVFVSNGRLYADRQKLRLSIGWPGERRTYFSKVEVLTVIEDDDDVEPARQRCAKLLDEALGVLLEDYYPSVEQLTAD